MSRTVNMHEAKTHLSRLVEAVLAGEEIILARAGKPVAKLVAVEAASERPLGFLKGRLTEAFFEPLLEEELKAWE
ncbi:type II toxin-antitoxin system prevent-host-death family antitoxin [bacterium CPR1]|nr:type II toxin-antitoxin system prevent-host-death family antitoxin [bacterium CPR1]